MIPKYDFPLSMQSLLKACFNTKASQDLLIQKLLDYYGVKHVILFTSARSALTCLLRALDFRGSIILPGYNCIAVPEAVVQANWKPLFADIAIDSVNMTYETIEKSLNANSKAVILTHQFGIPPPIEPIIELCKRKGLFLIEDAAASFGARYHGRLTGTFGNAAIISFHLSKILPSGHLGALLTNDRDIASRAMLLRGRNSSLFRSSVDCARVFFWLLATNRSTYIYSRSIRGIFKKDLLYETISPGPGRSVNIFRSCSNYVANIACSHLDQLPGNILSRQEIAKIYTDSIRCSRIKIPNIPEGAEPSWLHFPVFVQQKSHCYYYLLSNDVDLSWTFRYSLGDSYGIRTLPNSDKAAKSTLGLPTYAGIKAEEAAEIARLLIKSVYN